MESGGPGFSIQMPQVPVMRPWESPFSNPHLPLALKKKKEEVELISRNVPLPLTLPSFGVSEKCFLFFFLNFLHNENITHLLSLLINVCKEKLGVKSSLHLYSLFPTLPSVVKTQTHGTRSQRYIASSGHSCTDSWKRRRLLVPPECLMSR